jgi:hypothetical protein
MITMEEAVDGAPLEAHDTSTAEARAVTLSPWKLKHFGAATGGLQSAPSKTRCTRTS